MYDIMNYRSQDGVNQYVCVGTWDGEMVNGKIHSKISFLKNIKWLRGVDTPPNSSCSQKCDTRHEIFVPIPEFDFKCCWECKPCNKLQIVQNNTCADGPLGWIPNANRTGWVKRECVYPKWNDAPAISLGILSFVSLLLTIFTFVFYVKYKQNRLVKASGIELCFVMLIGIALCFIVPLLFIAKPGTFVCSARNVVSSLALVMCYAPLFMKVLRIYRIFTHAKKSVSRPSFVSPRMQLLMTSVLISFQLLFTALLSVTHPAMAKETYVSAREELLLECHIDSLSFHLNLSYVLLLMVLCTTYAFKTRNFPKNYNESKVIGVTMYVTCAVWAVFIPLYYNTLHGILNVYLASATYIITGLVTLIGLFGQKVFIVLSGKADMNDRNLFLPTGSSCSPVTQHREDNEG